MAEFISGQVEQSTQEKLKNFFKNITSKRTLSFLGILLLAVSLPITIFFSLQQQTYQQRAAAPQNELSSANFELDDDPIVSFTPEDIKKGEMYLHEYDHHLKPVLKQIQSQGIQSQGKNDYYITPILFIPNDKKSKYQYRDAIAKTFNRLRIWYNKTLTDSTGHTFNVKPLEIYKAPQPFNYYKCVNHISCDDDLSLWSNITDALQNAGYPIWVKGRIFVVFVVGGEGFAGGNCAPNCGVNWPFPGPAGESGFALLGDWALDGISGIRNENCIAKLTEALCTKNAQRGAVGHETGHTFGLAHANGDYRSIMWHWWQFPNISLINDPDNDEKGLLQTSTFFHKTPPLAPTTTPTPTADPNTTPTPTLSPRPLNWTTSKMFLKADNFYVDFEGERYYTNSSLTIKESVGANTSLVTGSWFDNGKSLSFTIGLFTSGTTWKWYYWEIKKSGYAKTGNDVTGDIPIGTAYNAGKLDIHSSDNAGSFHMDNLHLESYFPLITPTPTLSPGSIMWKYSSMSLQADNFYLDLDGERFYANTSDVKVTGNSYSDNKDLIIIWTENGKQMKITIYIDNRHTFWKSYQLNVQKDSDLRYFRDITVETPLGKPYTADTADYIDDSGKTWKIHFDKLILTSGY